MKDFPKITTMGERSVLIQFEPEISENMLGKVLSIKKTLQENYIKQEVEVTNTYNSLLISYTSVIENIYDEVLTLKTLISNTKLAKLPERKIFYIPVCYESEFGIDLELMSTQKNLSIPEIINLHTRPFYTVYFIGFLPGFLY
ncbi:MAG: carboxyltransferase domain-containing protein, partial [Gillisia sp.]